MLSTHKSTSTFLQSMSVYASMCALASPVQPLASYILSIRLAPNSM